MQDISLNLTDKVVNTTICLTNIVNSINIINNNITITSIISLNVESHFHFSFEEQKISKSSVRFYHSCSCSSAASYINPTLVVYTLLVQGRVLVLQQCDKRVLVIYYLKGQYEHYMVKNWELSAFFKEFKYVCNWKKQR